MKKNNQPRIIRQPHEQIIPEVQHSEINPSYQGAIERTAEHYHGCCNSLESKYKKQQYKIYDLTNTICKMAQKRSLIASVLASCGASQFFTQDLEALK